MSSYCVAVVGEHGQGVDIVGYVRVEADDFDSASSMAIAQAKAGGLIPADANGDLYAGVFRLAYGTSLIAVPGPDCRGVHTGHPEPVRPAAGFYEWFWPRIR